MTDLVRKRDGRLQSYREDKLSRVFLAAAGALWSADDGPALAAELARSITYFLFRRPSGHLGRVGRVVDSADIARAASRALAETGHAPAARAFDERARWRERRRGELRLPAEAGPATLIDGEGESPWSKSLVSSILSKEAGLDASLCAEIARSIEARIFAAGLRRVSLSVLREFMEAELLARGFEAGLPRASDGAELEALERGLDLGAAQDPESFRDELGDERLRAYIVDEVLTGAPARALRKGALAFLALERPLSLLARRVDLSWPADDPRSGLERLSAELGSARRSCSGPLVLDLRALPWLREEQDELLWGLNLTLRGRGEVVLRLSEPLRASPEAAIWIDGEAPGPVDRVLHVTSGTGAPSRFWMLEGGAAGDAIGELALLNLAHCAFRAGRGERDLFLEEVRSSLAIAAGGLARMRAFLETRVLKPELPLWQPELSASAPALRGDQIRYGLIPVGLDAALRYLTGESIAENTRVEELAVEVLRSLKRELREAGKAEGLALAIYDDDGRGAALARALARSDRLAFPDAAELEQSEYHSGLPPAPKLRRKLARALGLRPCQLLTAKAPAPAQSASSGSSSSSAGS